MSLKYAKEISSLKTLPFHRYASNANIKNLIQKKPLFQTLSAVLQKRLVHNTKKIEHTSLLTTTGTSTGANMYGSMTVKNLKAACKENGLKVSGSKKELIARLSTMPIRTTTSIDTDKKKMHSQATSNKKINNQGKKKREIVSPKKTQLIKEQIKQFSSSILSHKHKSVPALNYERSYANVQFPDMSALANSSTSNSVFMPFELSLSPPENILVNHNVNNINTKKIAGIPLGLLTVKNLKSTKVSRETLFTSLNADSTSISNIFVPSKEPLTKKDKYFLYGVVSLILVWWNSDIFSTFKQRD